MLSVRTHTHTHSDVCPLHTCQHTHGQAEKVDGPSLRWGRGPLLHVGVRGWGRASCSTSRGPRRWGRRNQHRWVSPWATGTQSERQEMGEISTRMQRHQLLSASEVKGIYFTSHVQRKCGCLPCGRRARDWEVEMKGVVSEMWVTQSSAPEVRRKMRGEGRFIKQIDSS